MDITGMLSRVEMILMGFTEGDVPQLCQISASGNVSLHERFSAIGEGGRLAEAVLLRREQQDTLNIEETLYNIYEAKRYAERVATVGTDTEMFVMTEPNLRNVTPNGYEQLSAMFEKFGPKDVEGLVIDPGTALND
jgi:20S proteasome alpha/beta subunit